MDIGIFVPIPDFCEKGTKIRSDIMLIEVFLKKLFGI